MNKHMKSALLCGLLVGGVATLSAQAPQSKQTPQTTQTPQSAERTTGTPGHVKEYTAGQRLVIDVAGAPERSYDLTSKSQNIVVAPGLKAGDSVRIVENDVNGKRTINIMMDNAAKK